MKRRIVAIAAALALVAAQAQAQAETLKLAVPQRGSWGTSYTDLGIRQGFFKAAGLDIEITYTEGGASNEQAVISGSVDIAIETGFLGILAAYVKGAPVRVISPASTGAPEVFWYAKAGSGLTSLKDAHGKSVGFSNPGSSSNLILLQLLKEAGVTDAKLVPVGASQNGLPLVMTGQLDMCYAVPPVALPELQNKTVVAVARGNDSEAVRNETVRVNAANLASLQGKRDAMARFIRAYAKSRDFAFTDAGMADYAKFTEQPLELVRFMVKNFEDKNQNELREIKGMDRVIDEAVAAKRIPKPMQPAELKAMFDFVAPDVD
jgi:NitT/TauT family transport system substrate-binding protein